MSAPTLTAALKSVLGRSVSTVILYTIYDHPTDYPESFVCRAHFLKDGQLIADPDLFWVGDSVAEIESVLWDMRLVPLSGEEPAEKRIVATWI